MSQEITSDEHLVSTGHYATRTMYLERIIKVRDSTIKELEAEIKDLNDMIKGPETLKPRKAKK